MKHTASESHSTSSAWLIDVTKMSLVVLSQLYLVGSQHFVVLESILLSPVLVVVLCYLFFKQVTTQLSSMPHKHCFYTDHIVLGLQYGDYIKLLLTVWYTELWLGWFVSGLILGTESDGNRLTKDISKLAQCTIHQWAKKEKVKIIT